MSQPLLKDPIVLSGPTRTGTGTGTVSIDKLTHFTTAQTYTLVCIAKSPDTIFSVSGSLDGPVGLATVGTQFFDSDLKIFLTIQQGGTVFEVGDTFVIGIQNGTDLDQDNIDAYDELAQKNFGLGIKGSLAGDHNLRYHDDTVSAYALLQGLKFLAVTPGANGNNLQVQTAAPVAGIAATGTLQSLSFTAKTAGVAGNGITVAFTQSVTPVKAQTTIQNVNYQALTGGTAGNAYTIAYTTGATAGSEVVSKTGNAISIQIASGASTPAQIVAAFNASALVNTLIFAKVTPIGNTTAQTAPVSAQSLTGGVNGSGTAGFEIVTVTGSAISVQCENGVSTYAQVKAALDASTPAFALIGTTTSSPSGTVTSGDGPNSLSGGVDGYGQPGLEKVIVTSNLITLYLTSGRSLVSVVLAAFNANSAATALASASVVGNTTDVMFSPGTLTQFQGGLSRFFAFNQHELTTSGSFFEGNASLKLERLTVQGAASFAKAVEMTDKLSLEDTSTEAGPRVPHVQRYLNRLMTLGKLTVRTSDGSSVTYSAGVLTFTSDLLIEQRDTGVTGTIAASSNSPLAIADGQSVYLPLNPATSGALTPIVASSVDKGVFVFRLCTRIGTKLVFFNGESYTNGMSKPLGAGISDQNLAATGLQSEADATTSFTTAGHTTSSTANRYVTDGDNLQKATKELDTRLGIVSDVEEQDRDIVLVGGGLWNFPSSGNLNFTADAFVSVPGVPNIRNRIAAASFGLLDGQCAYVEINRTGTSAAALAISVAAIDTFTADDNRIIFARRTGNVATLRDGTTLVFGETKGLGAGLSTSTLALLGVLSETDTAPNPVQSTSTPNNYISDTDSLPGSIKKLDTELGTHEANQSSAHGQTSANTPSKIVSRDSNGDFAARYVTLSKLIVATGTGGASGIDVPAAGDLDIGPSVGANTLWLGSSTSTVRIRGNLEVDGTTTTINSTELDVADTNITINKGGTAGSAEGAGLTVDKSSGTKGSLIYAIGATSRFKIGDLGSEIEIATIAGAQALTNKFISPVSNTITMSSGTLLIGSAGGSGQATALSGDATITAAGVLTISSSAITNAKLANMVNGTIKGRTTAGTGAPEDLTGTQATALLTNFVGDSGSGGTKGLVPAPAAGDAAAGKFLKADGSWAAPTASVTYRAGTAALTSGDTTKAVTFSSALASTSYRLAVMLVNTVDGSVQYVPITITAKSTTGFTASWPAGVDSSNYALDYTAFPDL